MVIAIAIDVFIGYGDCFKSNYMIELLVPMAFFLLRHLKHNIIGAPLNIIFNLPFRHRNQHDEKKQEWFQYWNRMDFVKKIDVICTDFAKTFDKMDFLVLISKLAEISFSVFMYSYILNRRQYVYFKRQPSNENIFHKDLTSALCCSYCYLINNYRQ